jgi:acyl-CoA synthetase (AMP-forming)/AMP-acid ligase II/NADP-dependent 3-hydroxy acid dehydrogenase YdfG/acyl carrier protein
MELSDRLRNLPPERQQLLRRLLEREGVGASLLPIEARGTEVSEAPLSHAQRSFWFMTQLAPESPFYNQPMALRLTGALDVEALQWACGEIVRRHAILRTIFPAADGKPVQRVLAGIPVSIERVDLADLPREEREAQAAELACAESRQPFNLAIGPLIRLVLYRLAEDEHILLRNMHHMVWDGWSNALFDRELAALYAVRRRGEPSPLPPLPLQYADYAFWQREQLSGERLDAQVAWWRQRLAGAPRLDLPTDRPRPAEQTFDGGALLVDLTPELGGALEALSHDAGVTLFMTLLAGFQVLLARYTGQDQILVGTPVANRGRRELEGMIGCFANVVVLAADLSGDPTFRELLARVKEVTAGAYAHQEIPFELLVEKLAIERDPSRNPIFQVMFALHNELVAPLQLAGLKVEPVPLGGGTTHFDLELRLWHRDGSRGHVTYNQDLYDEATVVRMLAQYRVLLEAVAADPGRPISALLILPAEELGWLAVRAQGGPRSESLVGRDEACVHLTPAALQERLAAGTTWPDGLRAVVCGGGLLGTETAAAALRALPCPLIYVYAPPEAAAEVACWRCTGSETGRFVPAGAPDGIGVRIVDSRGRLAPIGVPGTIEVAPPAATGASRFVATGERGRFRADGTLELLGAADRRIWWDGRRVDLEDLEAAALAEPAVDACRLLQRFAGDAEELVAYTVWSHRPAPERLLEILRRELPAGAPAPRVAGIDRLPLTADGRVDDAALARLEVVDDELVERWESRLRAVPGVEQVKVLARERAELPPPLHLSDLFPEWRAGLDDEHTTKIDAGGEAFRETGEALALAYADGGPLALPDDAPRTLGESLVRAAAAWPERGVTLIGDAEAPVHLSYPELLSRARSVLAGLRARGLRPRDRIILQLELLGDHLISFWACVLGGIIPITVARPATYDRKSSVLSKLWNTWELLERPPILSSARLLPLLANVPALYHERGDEAGFVLLRFEDLAGSAPAEDLYAAAPDEVVFHQLSSGSTGIPKCIQETHRGILHHVHAVKVFNGHTEDDVDLNWLPFDHVVPTLTSHVKDVCLGLRQVQVRTEVILAEPLRWLELLETYRVTHGWSPNFAYKLVCDALSRAPHRHFDLSSVVFLMNGGEQITLPVVEEFLRRTAPFGLRQEVMQPAYGMAEVCTAITYCNGFSPERAAHRIVKTSLGGRLEEAAEAAPGTITFIDVGPPLPGVQIRIAGPDLEVLPERVIGRLQVRGDVVTAGYLRNEEANREAFVGDGWFDTGDLGFLADGRLTVTGRQKEMIIIRGANFYCYEIEDVVNSLDGVEPTFSAACAVDDAQTGTEGLAIFFVPRRPGIDPDLLATVRNAVARNFSVVPSFVVPLTKETFPKTTSGKIQRTQLKKSLAAGAFAGLLKEIDLATENDNTVPRWFLESVWRRREPAVRARRPAGGATLVLLDAGGLGEALVEQLGEAVRVAAGEAFARLSRERYVIDPRREEDFAALLAALRDDGVAIARVVHLWPCDRRGGDPETAQIFGAYSLLSLAQALARTRGGETPVRLLTVSGHGQEGEPAPEHAPLLGLVKTLPQEWPWLECRYVTLSLEDPEADAGRLAAELAVLDKDREVAYRRGVRCIRRLAPVELQRGGELPIARSAMVLVTGGLGGIGFHVARHLAATCAPRLLLVGRTPLEGPEGEEEPAAAPADADAIAARTSRAERRERLARLQGLGGEVAYAAADVADAERLREVVRHWEERWGTRLACVIHLAGVFPSRLLAEETRESFAATLRPKLLGTWHLRRLLPADGLFVAFGSINPFFGGVATGAYSAAGNFVEALIADDRRRGGRSFCFSWSNWDDVGMSHGYRLKEQSEGRGYRMIRAAQGVSSWLAGLCQPAAGSWLIGLDPRRINVRRHLDGPAVPLLGLTAWYAPAPGAAPAAEIRRAEVRDRFGIPSCCQTVELAHLPRTAGGEIDAACLDGPAAARRAEQVLPSTGLEHAIAAIWREVLQVDDIGIHQSFFELGGQSILLAQVLGRLQQRLGRQLTMVELLRYPTIASLAGFLGETEERKPTYDAARDRARQQQRLRQAPPAWRQGRG